MKPLFTLLFAALILCAVRPAFARQNTEFSGTITDDKGEALIGATVRLFSETDSSFRRGTVSDTEGVYRFRLPAGKYLLKVSFVGFLSQEKTFNWPLKAGELSDFQLITDVRKLDEIEVVGKINPTEIKGDTTVFDAKAFKTNPDATAENLLEKMPGVVVSEGKVQAQGEDVKQVLVDGKAFFGSDPNAALKNIPAEIISKIEVFDQASEQTQQTGFDDGETTKTINIITKVEFRNGTFGDVYAGYGSDDKYSAGGTANIFDGDRRISILGQANNINRQNFSSEDLVGVMSASGGSGRGGRGGGRRGGGGGRGGRGGPGGGGSSVNDFLVGQQSGITDTKAFGINYSDKIGEKLDLTASYFFNSGDNISETGLSRQYLSVGETGQLYDETETAESQNINHRLNLRLTYKLNRQTTLVLRPALSWQQNNGSSISAAGTTENERPLNSSDNNFGSDLSGMNFSNMLIFRRRMAKRGRSISVFARQQHNKNTGLSNLQADNFYYTDSFADSLNQQADLDKYENTLSANFMYSEPLTEGLMVQFNYSTSFSDNRSDKKTLEFEENTQNYSRVDTLLTNVYESTYRTHQGGIGLSYRDRKLRISARAAWQTAQLEGTQTFPYRANISRTFGGLLPNLRFRYRLSRDKNISLSYRSSTSAPSVSQLQEVLDNTNTLQQEMGNSALDQQVNHNVFLRYSAAVPDKGKVFFAMIRANFTNDYIAESTLFAERDTTAGEVFLPAGSQLIRPMNADGYFSLQSFLTYGLPLWAIKSNFNMNLSAAYSQTPGFLNGEINYARSPTFGAGLSLSSNISDKVDFTFSSNAQYSRSDNSLNPELNNSFWTRRNKARVYWNFWKNLVFRTDVENIIYSGLGEDFNQNYTLWNASLGMKFMKQKQAEFTLSANDLLNANTNVSRTFTAAYTEDSRTRVLRQYFLLSFRYKFKKFRSAKEAE